jgi:hypothetical protein
MRLDAIRSGAAKHVPHPVPRRKGSRHDAPTRIFAIPARFDVLTIDRILSNVPLKTIKRNGTFIHPY